MEKYRKKTVENRKKMQNLIIEKKIMHKNAIKIVWGGQKFCVLFWGENCAHFFCNFGGFEVKK